MSFAGFDDFNACILDQKKKGLNSMDAKRVCGFLQKKFETGEKVKQEGNYYVTESGQKYTKDGYKVVAQDVPVIFECKMTVITEKKEDENGKSG